MKMRLIRTVCFLGLAAPLMICDAAVANAHADTAVIVNLNNKASLQPEQIKNIFLGRLNRFPDGSPAKPVDQPEERPIRITFYSKVAGKDEDEMKTYWADLIFSGNGRPPKAVDEDSEVKQYVRETVGGIGYIDSKSLDGSVRVIYTLK